MGCMPVPDTAKSGELWRQILGDRGEPPAIVWSIAFCGALGVMCYTFKPSQLDQANGVLLAGVLLSFGVRTPSCSF